MSKEKQIEEMADIIYSKINGANFDDVSDAVVALYDAGYRKQSEGEWIHDMNNLYGCSNCLWRSAMSPKMMLPYCPRCGAKMKGD